MLSRRGDGDVIQKNVDVKVSAARAAYTLHSTHSHVKAIACLARTLDADTGLSKARSKRVTTWNAVVKHG